MRQAVTGFGVSPVPIQMLLLGGIHVANCAVIYLLVGIAARRCSAPDQAPPESSAEPPASS